MRLRIGESGLIQVPACALFHLRAGGDVAKRVDDWFEIARDYHVNEQGVHSLRRALARAGPGMLSRLFGVDHGIQIHVGRAEPLNRVEEVLCRIVSVFEIRD